MTVQEQNRYRSMFKEIKPRSAVLKRYILSYTLLADQSPFPLNYCAFPQPGTSLAFFSGAGIAIDNNKLVISPAAGRPVQPVVLGKYLMPLLISYTGFVQEISINFRPAAINQFFDIPFSQLAPCPIQEIEVARLPAIRNEWFMAGTEEKIALLEEYLLHRYKPKPLEQLEQAVAILEEDDTISISELARRVHLTERTLNRSFTQYIGCAPSSFRRILRFRQSIDRGYFAPQRFTCTDICFRHSFYDTAHFRKEFRRLTGQNPKEFFASISLVGEGQYPFRLV